MTIEHKTRPPKLMAYHYEAIEQRYLGNTYPAVAEYLTGKYKRDFNPETVRWWFSQKGYLFDLYIDYAARENERRRRLMQEELRKLVPSIPKKFADLLNRVQRVPFTGEVLKDPDSKKEIDKLDMTTVAALKLLCEILDFKRIGEDTPGNPIDEYFDRLENEVKPQDNAKSIPQ